MPINKPTISHQLKTVKFLKPKVGSVIHAAPYLSVSSPHQRSHLRGGNTFYNKSSYDQRENIMDSNDITRTELQQCTRILRNVLANEGINHDLNMERKDKSTSTTDCVRVDVDDSLSSITEIKSPLNYTSRMTLCTCDKDCSMKISAHRGVSASVDCTKDVKEKASLCARCHNLILPELHLDQECGVNTRDKESDIGFNRDRASAEPVFKSHAAHNVYNTSSSGEYIPSPKYTHVVDESVDNLSELLQRKVSEVGLIARATRDADLDRLVVEINRLLQEMIKEYNLSFTHLNSLTKTLKVDNCTLKQKVKNQSEINRDLKSELKLLRQENKQKIEELKLEIQIKDEEVRQLIDKDKNSMTVWKDKCHKVEKDQERLRDEYQSQVLQSCQKDTEILHMKHTCTQTELKLKEEIHSLKLVNQNLQVELSKVQESVKKYDQECHHNQSIIKAAREHVVQLLDRHRQDRDGSITSGSHRLESWYDTPLNNSADWIHQATNLQQVLSLVSERKCSMNNVSDYCARSRSTTITPSNLVTNNCNNNYVSSSTCNPNISDSSNKFIDETVKLLQYTNENLDHLDRSRSSDDISSTISQRSFPSLLKKTKEKDNFNSICGEGLSFAINAGALNNAIVSGDDLWHLNLPKSKISSTSSVMSTVSSLRSSDDQNFRSGLQRLDSQISRLQSTLQSKLHVR